MAGLAEGLLRLGGFGAFPLYQADPTSRYRMRSDQAGRFRRRIRWKYDPNGMRTYNPPRGFAGVTLLVGDSIVEGGLRVSQSQTLAALATRMSGEPFYPVACHGWALGNMLPALAALPGWADARRLVFVMNTQDLDSVCELEDELNFPTRYPLWLTGWLLRRKVLRLFQVLSLRRRAKRRDEGLRAGNIAAFAKLIAEYEGEVVLVRYPQKGEDPREEPYYEELAAIDPRIRIIDVLDAQGWSEACYADHLHPNVRGLGVFARHLCRALASPAS